MSFGFRGFCISKLLSLGSFLIIDSLWLDSSLKTFRFPRGNAFYPDGTFYPIASTRPRHCSEELLLGFLVSVFLSVFLFFFFLFFWRERWESRGQIPFWIPLLRVFVHCTCSSWFYILIFRFPPVSISHSDTFCCSLCGLLLFLLFKCTFLRL